MAVVISLASPPDSRDHTGQSNE